MNCGGRCWMNTIEMAENELLDLLSPIAEANRVVLNGACETASIVYRISGEEPICESNVPIMTRVRAQVYVYQREYTANLVWQVRSALQERGWSARLGAQVLDGDCYRDELSASKVYVW